MRNSSNRRRRCDTKTKRRCRFWLPEPPSIKPRFESSTLEHFGTLYYHSESTSANEPESLARALRRSLTPPASWCAARNASLTGMFGVPSRSCVKSCHEVSTHNVAILAGGRRSSGKRNGRMRASPSSCHPDSRCLCCRAIAEIATSDGATLVRHSRDAANAPFRDAFQAP